MPPIFRSEVCVRNFKPSIRLGLMNLRGGPAFSDFHYANVLAAAVKRAGLTEEPDRIAVPDAEWWQRLCASCSEKPCSKYGGKLLLEKLIHSLSQRLAVEEQYRLHGAEIEKITLKDPTFVIGLPRCDGHQAAHVLARSGVYCGPRSVDTLFPGVANDLERSAKGRKSIKMISPWIYPYFQTLRTMDPDKIDDDVMIHLQTPQSVSWGLLHGLQDHLYKTLQEDQQPVFDHMARVLKLLKWYQTQGLLNDNVERDIMSTGIGIDDALRGKKEPINVDDQPFIIHSPLSLSFIANLHQAFPDMRVIWVHRALNQCIPSFCSSLAIHNTLYTGRRPTETQLAGIGEQVVGFLGSGSEYAVDYLGTFPKERMVHWSNREIRRSVIRLAQKTIQYYGLELDFYRRMQAVNGATEYCRYFRPKHDVELGFFGLHEGQIGEVFEAYILQFEEYAFEKKFGIKHQNLVPLSQTRHEFIGARNQKLGPSEGHALGQIGIQSGHYLQDSHYYSR